MDRINALWEKTFNDRWYRFALHTLFWTVYFLYGTHESVVINVNGRIPLALNLAGSALSLFLFYPLVYGIVPLFYKRKWIGAIVLFLLYYFLAVIFRGVYIRSYVDWFNTHKINPQAMVTFEGEYFWRELVKAKGDPLGWLAAFLSSITTLIANIDTPLALMFLRYAYRLNVRQAWLAKENSKLQLATLKSQLNPHFFFNTLNNLQSFIIQNEKEKSVDLLTRLAEFMRTSLYQTDGEQITMKQEMQLLQNYISIEKVRFDEATKIKINFTDQDPDFRVPTFLFLPFIENVFKHAGDQTTENIRINIDLMNDISQVTLRTTNTYRRESGLQGGFGLLNVRKRLNYYYPERYHLQVDKTPSQFIATLSIRK